MTSKGLAPEQGWKDIHEDTEELCAPCCVAGIKVVKPLPSVKCSSCAERERGRGVQNPGTARVIGECSPKVIVHKPATSCTPCRDAVHNAGSQQLAVISSLKYRPEAPEADKEDVHKELTAEEEEAYMTPLPEDSEQEEEEGEKIDRCVACGDNLLAGLTILTMDGPLHVKCWEKTPAGRKAKENGDPQYIYNDPRQPPYMCMKEKCVEKPEAAKEKANVNSEEESDSEYFRSRKEMGRLQGGNHHGPHPHDPYDDKLTPGVITKAHDKLAEEAEEKGVATRYGEAILPKEEMKLGEESWAYIAPELKAGDIFRCGGGDLPDRAHRAGGGAGEA